MQAAMFSLFAPHPPCCVYSVLHVTVTFSSHVYLCLRLSSLELSAGLDLALRWHRLPACKHVALRSATTHHQRMRTPREHLPALRATRLHVGAQKQSRVDREVIRALPALQLLKRLANCLRRGVRRPTRTTCDAKAVGELGQGLNALRVYRNGSSASQEGQSVAQDGDNVHRGSNHEAGEAARACRVDNVAGASPASTLAVVVSSAVSLPGVKHLVGDIGGRRGICDVLLGLQQLQPGDGEQVGGQGVKGVRWVRICAVEVVVLEESEVRLTVGMDEGQGVCRSEDRLEVVAAGWVPLARSLLLLLLPIVDRRCIGHGLVGLRGVHRGSICARLLRICRGFCGLVCGYVGVGALFLLLGILVLFSFALVQDPHPLGHSSGNKTSSVIHHEPPATDF
ncbi:hypothetical protein CCHR01_03405 [Colletotrichum chrysophilum]|uniref:Uncharacterized protein n=1 Tax=Colletotrichum chrysophilum TaxID=1836956 RepID=A0AAD9AVD2_9PEZI|nr:hypothetical protein CCHR01_03405 [Colletotrichum chrysophilum]